MRVRHKTLMKKFETFMMTTVKVVSDGPSKACQSITEVRRGTLEKNIETLRKKVSVNRDDCAGRTVKVMMARHKYS